MDNIGLPDSLLSRFDLLFIMLDEMRPERDRMLAGHVLRSHCFRKTGEADGAALQVGFLFVFVFCLICLVVCLPYAYTLLGTSVCGVVGCVRACVRDQARVGRARAKRC